MASTWTRIHEHLGLRPGPLSVENVLDAARDGLREADVLDWKGVLPQPPRDGAWNEFAKDVAAMANTRGGLLIYGVSDDLELDGIDPAAADVRKYGQWLRNHVRPFLVDVDYLVLTSPSEQKSFLVVDVPASEFAPHSVTGTAARDKDQNAFVVPYRDHDHTAWMEEHQIARAYRERFAGQQRHDQALSALWAAARDLVVEPVGEEAWVIFAAQPIRPVPRLAGEVARVDVAVIVEKAFAAAVEIRTTRGEVVPVLYNAGANRNNPRVGLRSWVVSNAVASGDRDALRGVYVQLGHDCSVVFAVNVSTKTYREDGPTGVHVVNAEVVDVAAGEFIALAQELGRHLYIESPLGIHAGLAAREGTALAYECATRDGLGHFTASRSSRKPRRIQPWTTEIIPNGSVETTRGAAEELASALLNQFGVSSRLYR
ncbi:ATP-binding protein [Amycolatopsis sp. NPDC026612]|uniref:AlbA family DNA-binding domain-containing protein n=1 Tax=Amycolatopsis sp. NPDC026612 TaxID=3155466 RepID=UPI0033D4C068